MSGFRLFSWGANSHGQLGHDNVNENELLIPKEVDLSYVDLKPENIKKIVGGGGHTLFLDKFGKVYSCGWNSKGQAGIAESSWKIQKLKCLEDEKIVDVACGWDSSMVVTENGEIFVWGSNSHGQLGLSISAGKKIDKPMKLDFNAPVRQIAMGMRNSILVTEDGKVFICGDASKGQFGCAFSYPNSRITYSDKFLEVTGVPPLKNVSCGQHHIIGITKNNEMYVCGDNKHGQLGLPLQTHGTSQYEIMQVPYDESYEKIYCGWTHSVLLTSDKKVLSWGRNTYGQLGRETTTSCKPVPVNISSKIQQLSVGSEHTIALTDVGIVLSWGWNEHGNCGNGSTENVFLPIEVPLPKGLGILIGTGAGSSFAVIDKNC